MRYYNVVLTKADGTPYLFKSLGGLALTSLAPNGRTNPGALNIEFDLPIANLTNPDNNAWLRCWGLSIADIGIASDLNGLNVSVYGGMAKGLPLANPAQAGLLLQGQIFQAFGNWVGTDQTIDMNFIVGGNAGSPDAPANFPFQWQAGEPLATAIAQTLSTALPGMTQQINISPNLVLNYAMTGWYQSAQQFADFINEVSSALIGGTYTGVNIVTDGQTIRDFASNSAAQATATKMIAFQDMIGQPTWIGPGTISVKLVLRADLHIGDIIQLPPSLVTVTSAGAAQYLSLVSQPANRTAFSGNYQIAHCHHYGNFRQSDSASWATVLQAYPLPA
jgi:hypothetical protein